MNTESLEKLCKIAEREVEDVVNVIEREGKSLTAEDVRYIDGLTHTIKSIKTTLAMEGYGSSERRGRDSMGRYTSRDGGSYDGGYSNRSYGGSYGGGSYDGSMHGNDDPREHLRRLMNSTDDEKVRRALREAMNNL